MKFLERGKTKEKKKKKTDQWLPGTEGGSKD